jgi:hypothetical protein
MRLKTHQNAVIALAAIAGLTTFARTAQAQIPVSDLHPSFYGSAELDSRHTQFYLIGMYVGMGGLGWSPYFNVNAYSLHYRFNPVVATSDSTLSAISPTIGMAYAGRNQGVSIGGGYTWVDHEDAGAPGAEGGGANGATVSIGAYNNGTGKRPMHMQLLSNYNFGSKYGWARGRASVPFGHSSKHPSRIGAEVVGQGGGKDPLTSNSFQVGPTLEYGWTPQFRTTAAAGYKSVGGSPRFPSRESAGYLKLEFSFSP